VDATSPAVIGAGIGVGGDVVAQADAAFVPAGSARLRAGGLDWMALSLAEFRRVPGLEDR
jgi:hypothetical protein